MIRKLFGKCFCGSVQYEVCDEFEYAFYCHCSDCRRATGSAFKPLAGIPRTKLKLTSGHDTLLIHGEEKGAHDVHCRKCGSLLFSVVREGLVAHVAMGSLVDVPGIRPSSHIFVGSKADWYEIADDLPKHKAFPD